MLPDNRFRFVAFEGLRFALVIVYIWFGLLKVLYLSSLLSLVQLAYPVIGQSHALYVALGLLEVAIGIGILIPRISTIMLWTAFWHLIVTTIGVFASSQGFTSVGVLSFAGEFVVKNFVLAMAALALISHDEELYRVNNR